MIVTWLTDYQRTSSGKSKRLQIWRVHTFYDPEIHKENNFWNLPLTQHPLRGVEVCTEKLYADNVTGIPLVIVELIENKSEFSN